MTAAYPAARPDLERASEGFRRFREQPTAELAQSAREGVRSAISPNARLQQIYHPWTSYVIVPLFALANAGVGISGSDLARAFTSPITLGILVGYVAGKPLGTIGAAWLLERLLGRAPAAAGGLGRRHRGGHDRRDRVHRVAADLGDRLHRRRSWRTPRSVSCRPRSARPRSPGWSCASPRGSPGGCGRGRCSARRSPSSTWPYRSTSTTTTSAARRSRRSRWWSTATSSASSAGRPSRSSGSCWPTTATSTTCGGTCR